MLLVIIIILVEVLVPDIIESRLIRGFYILLSFRRPFCRIKPVHCGFQFDIISPLVDHCFSLSNGCFRNLRL